MVQAEQPIAGAHHPRKAGFVEAQVGEELVPVGVVQLADLGFDLRAHGHHDGAVFLGEGGHLVEQRVVREAVFVDVGDEHHRLLGDEVALAQGGELVRRQAEGAHRLASVQALSHAVENGEHGAGVLVASIGDALVAVVDALGGLQVGERKLQVDDRDVVGRRDAPRHVHHVGVAEAAHHVGDGVGLADVREELIAEPFALRRAGDEAGDVHELHRARHHPRRRDDCRQAVEARIGHRHHAGVRFDGAERKVLGVDGGAREGVEERGLADVRQADDAALESHQDALAPSGALSAALFGA